MSAAHVLGLYYVSDVLSLEIMKEISAALDVGEWEPAMNGRVVKQFGFSYDYKKRSLKGKAPAFPDWLTAIAELLDTQCRSLELKNVSKFNQCIVNKYDPGEGISPHTDAPVFGDIIGCFTIGSGATMTFTPIGRGSSSHMVYTQPGSVYVMSGDARYKWKHEMPCRKVDEVDGVRLKRGKRISLTFRQVS